MVDNKTTDEKIAKKVPRKMAPGRPRLEKRFSNEISSMSGQMDSLTPMNNNIQSMTHNIGSMNRSVYGMQRDMHGMHRTVSSGPFGMMNDVMPFNSNTNVPPDMPPPQVWPSYNTVPQYQPYPPVAPVRRVVPQKSIKKEVSAPVVSPVHLKSHLLRMRLVNNL